MKDTALGMACLAALIAAGCSYVVVADRAKVQDNLYQPSVLPDATVEAGDDGSAQVTEGGGDMEGGDASAEAGAGGEGGAPEAGGVGEAAAD